MSSTGTSTATDELRRPFLIIAIVLMAVVVLIEVGSAGILKQVPVSPTEMRRIAQEEADQDDEDDFDGENLPLVKDDVDKAVEQMQVLADDNRPPGLAIPYMALLDVLLLVALGLMGLGLVIPERIQGRAQGIVDLILAIVLVIGSIVFIIIAFVLLLVMIALLTAAPWGTIAYFAIYAFFDRTGAAIVLGILMVLKLGTCVSLVVAQQRFLQAKSLVLMMATSLVAMLIVGFLHNIVPLFLVSITDAIAAIIIAILALIWAIVLLIMAIVAIVKLIL